MDAGAIVTAVLLGIVSGYLVIRIFDCLAAFGFCLHALYKARWSRHQSARDRKNQASPKVIQQLMIQVTLTALLFGVLLYYGYDFTRREPWFHYSQWGVILYAAVACLTALSRLAATRRRLVFFWRTTHEFDYAQKRRRTLLLRS